jgi:hypothetical protein
LPFRVAWKGGDGLRIRGGRESIVYIGVQTRPALNAPSSPAARKAFTTGFAAAGVALFWLADLPLPFLFGPMTACLLAALLGFPLLAFPKLALAARTILGVAVGSAITPEVVGQLPQMAASVAFIPLFILVIALIGVPFFHKVAKYDLATAWYAAMPGGLQDMIAFGAEAGANTRTLSLVHATRVLIIVTLAPILLTRLFDAPLTNPIGASATSLPLKDMALMVAAAYFGWKGGERVGLFGASIIGPMIATAALTMTGLITHRPPAEAILAAQFVIGLGIGTGYVGVTLAELRTDVSWGVVYVLILAALAALFTEIVVHLGLARPLEGFMAFAPGGQAEMTVLAIVVGADLGFVIVHHLTRLILVITCAPLAARFVRGRRNR